MKEFDLDEKGYLSICEKGAFDMVDAEIILTPNEVDELKKAISVKRCCVTLKIKELMTFKDYRKNLFIKADGVYQPKNTKLFVWYSKKQLKKMYLNKPL